MFEKEVEEYVMRKDVITENDRVPFDNGYGFQTVSFEDEVKKAFKDGAEFGYNKANEWHYVKDELPPVKKEYCGRSELVLVVSKEKKMQYAQYVEKEKAWARGICAINFEPYAWKEIELPKEIKEK